MSYHISFPYYNTLFYFVLKYAFFLILQLFHIHHIVFQPPILVVLFLLIFFLVKNREYKKAFFWRGRNEQLQGLPALKYCIKSVPCSQHAGVIIVYPLQVYYIQCCSLLICRRVYRVLGHNRTVDQKSSDSIFFFF